MYYSVRSGTDGIGLDFDFGVFADDIAQARIEAAESLRNRGFELQADRGLFTVHGHSAWILATDENGYKIVPDNSPEPRKTTIIKLDADSYAARITEFAADSPELPSAEALDAVRWDVRELWS